ncbi:MAG TPA: hypothetical protein VGM05_28145 [Planctomycetaceae bacterium]|jgi:hypothetical protein
MATHDDFQQEPAPQAKKSSGSKVLLILGTIAGLGLVVCCGGAGFLYYKFKDAISVTKDPVEVKKQTEELVTIEIPSTFTPLASTRVATPVVNMKMIMYQSGAGNEDAMVLMEMSAPGADPKQMRDQMLQQMRTQQAQGSGFNSQINAQSKETRKFKINGDDVEFDFIKGTRGSDPTVYRQIVGVFQGRNGFILLMLMIRDSDYDEEAVLKMIKSIRVPGSDTPTEVMDDSMGESSSEEGMPEKEDGAADESETAPDKSE